MCELAKPLLIITSYRQTLRWFNCILSCHFWIRLARDSESKGKRFFARCLTAEKLGCGIKNRQESGLSHSGGKEGESWVGGLLHVRRTPLHLFTAQPLSNLKPRFPYKPQFLFPILNAKQSLWITESQLLGFRPNFPPKFLGYLLEYLLTVVHNGQLWEEKLIIFTEE